MVKLGKFITIAPFDLCQHNFNRCDVMGLFFLQVLKFILQRIIGVCYNKYEKLRKRRFNQFFIL